MTRMDNDRSNPATGRITPLSRPTSTTLRSSLIIPTYPSVLQELIHNSLDAGATCIDIWIDASSGNERIRVEDDGCGIGRTDLGRIGGRYETSKSGIGDTGSTLLAGSYGFRGEALSSIAALGIVDITTKTRASKQTWSKVIKGSKVLFEGVSPRSIPGESGTTITVKELFYNVPVRQRRLAEKTPQSMLMACRKIVETLALVRPGVRWSLWEDAAIGSSAGAKRIFSLDETTTSLEAFRAIYGSAGVEKVQKVRVIAGRRKVEGFISLEGLVNKSHQHLYVNSFPVERGDLQHAISKRFAGSRFSAMTRDSLLEDDSANYMRKSPRKLERHPIYVLNIILPPEEVDALYEPRKMIFGYKDVDEVKALVLAVVDEFLQRHGFLSRPISAIEAISPIPKQPHGGATRAAPQQHTPTRRTVRNDLPTTPLRAGTTSRSPDLHASRFQTPPGVLIPGELPPRARPQARKRRKGSSPVESDQEQDNLEWLQALITRSRARRRSDGRLQPELNSSDESEVERSHHVSEVACRHAMPINLPRSQLPHTDITFSTSSLSTAAVLGQIDSKFIACILQSDSKQSRPSQKVLVVIDQHAADERVSVEGILEGLCSGFLDDTVDTVELKNPGPIIILSREEATALHHPGAIDIFRRWGIDIDVPDVENDYVQIAVKTIPKALVARLGTRDARELTRLVKLYLPDLVDHMEELQVLLAESSEKEVDWGRAMRWMPKEMLELANSKACRSSIMFGDKLDRDQCERLIRRLGETRQGFMCAHGRPSLVPLAVLDRRELVGTRTIDWASHKQVLLDEELRAITA